MDDITIHFKISDRASIHSGHKSSFTIDRAEWEGMTTDQKYDRVMEEAWAQDMIEVTFDGQDD
ncbi:DUF7167 family protein [Deinococcus kurensis]|uniref:DUF7167 family protein n=1 Tax=Deinococcus kurensis TaxID=2662757 RepID=UPI0012D363C5|nr:hypothetical protein [Deinococcus kurensis]